MDVRVKIGGSPFNLTGIDQNGKVRWQIMVPFLRNVVVSRTFVGYSDHNAVLGLWSPAHGGNSTLAFLRRNWKTYVRDIYTGRLLWSRSIVDAGEPLAFSDDSDFWTIRLINTTAYFLKGDVARYALELRHARTGGLTHAWRLPELHQSGEIFDVLPKPEPPTDRHKDSQRFLDGQWALSFVSSEDTGGELEMTFKGKEGNPDVDLRYTRAHRRIQLSIRGRNIHLERLK